MSKKEKFHFWYSEKQFQQIKKGWGDGAYTICHAKLDGGKITQYTECNPEKRKVGNWDDYQYLGRGIIFKVKTLGGGGK